jgi:hypothetical protein
MESQMSNPAEVENPEKIEPPPALPVPISTSGGGEEAEADVNAILKVLFPDQGPSLSLGKSHYQ